MLEEIFDRQGLIVQVVPPKGSYQVEFQHPTQLCFKVVRPSGQVSLRPELVRELYHRLGEWIDKLDGVDPC
jgi:hypothetical protein